MSRPESDWVAAGSELRHVLERGTPSKHYLVARALDWSPAKLSRTLSGDRCPTIDECLHLQEFLNRALPDENVAPITHQWYIDAPPLDDEAAGPEIAGRIVTRRFPRRQTLLASALVVATVAVVAIVLQSQSGRSSEPFLPSQECPAAVGQALEAEAMGFTEIIVDTYQRAGGISELGCPSARMALWSEAARQDFETDAGVRSVIIAASPDVGIALPPTQWQSYRRIRGATTPDLLGHPLSLNAVDGYFEIPLTLGGALVSERPTAPFFWLHPLMHEAWQAARDQLGLPVSNAFISDTSLRQEFQRGALVASEPGVTKIPSVYVDADGFSSEAVIVDTSTPVAPEVEPGTMISQADGTKWLIDATGSRLWVLNRTIEDCLGLTVAAEFSATDIATLPYVGTAVCEI